MYEVASLTVFFSNMVAFMRVPIIYAWIIAVNVFAYAISFSQSASLQRLPWIVHRAKHWFYLKKPLPNKTVFFYFFGVAVRFDWIKIDVWLKFQIRRSFKSIPVDPNCHYVGLKWSTAFDPGLSVNQSRSTAVIPGWARGEARLGWSEFNTPYFKMAAILVFFCLLAN